MLEFDECPCSGRNLDKLLSPMILLELIHQDLHGYEIVRRLRNSPLMGGDKPDSAGVYRVLRGMKSKGFLTAVWETGERGPAKRRYHLTRSGRQCLARWRVTIEAHIKSLNRLLAMMRKACPPVERRCACKRRAPMRSSSATRA